MSSLEFKNLPLMEVAINFWLADNPVKAPVNLASKLRELMPESLRTFTTLQTREARPDSIPESPEAPLLGDTATGLTIIIQSNLIAARWLRFFEGNRTEYPRFSSLRALIGQAVEHVNSELAIPVRVSTAQVAYINFLPKSESSNERYLEQYILPAALGLRPSTLVADHQIEVAWQDEEVDLRYELLRARIQGIETTPEIGYLIKTTAGKMMSPGGDPFAVVDSSHANLQRLFLGLITDQAKEEWQYSG